MEGISEFKRQAAFSVLVITAVAFAGCSADTLGGISSSTQSTSSGGQFTGSNLEGGNVSEVSFDDSNQATITFDSPTETEKYVLMVYSYNEDGRTEAYQMGSLSDLVSPVRLQALTSGQSSQDVTEDFHQNLREMEDELEGADAVASSAGASRLAKKTVNPSVGDTKVFRVLSSFSGTGNYEQVKGVLKYKTANFHAYVDSRNLDAIDDASLADLLESFNNIIPQERSLFGTESDVDGDGAFSILFTQTVNELGGSSGGIVTGFFYAVDLFSQNTYAQSNETEILYTFVPDPEGEFGTAVSEEFALSNILRSVLPHEFQHMINFNQKYFMNGGSPEKSFLNEALSHLAEDIYTGFGATENENPARVAGYLASIDDLCIVCGASLYQRGGSYLMLRYLYEQADKGGLPGATSGQQLIDRMLSSTSTGVENIVQAAYGDDVSDIAGQFRALMGQFGLATFLSNTGLSSDSRFNFVGINLRTSQSDNRGTVLQGPIVYSMDEYSLSSTVGGASLSFVEITSEDIQSLGGQIAVQLSDQGQAGAYLIQTGL